MKKTLLFPVAFMALAGVFVSLACRRQPQSRQYEEPSSVAPEAPSPSVPAPVAGTWHWRTPGQWRQEAGEGMRLATFFFAEGNEPGQCTLVSLPGDGGGAEANVQRWLAQMGREPLPPAELAAFLRRQETSRTEGGLPVTIVDFTDLPEPSGPGSASMMVAIVSGESQTLFVKMSGEKPLLRKHREDFLDFCRSLSLGG